MKKKHKRHLMASSAILVLVIIIYLMKIIDWKIAISIFIIIFPYLSFSLLIANEKTKRKKNAIDVMKRKYST